MLPDLRVVTIAVISTFLFAVSVGFYTSSRLMSERKPRADSLAAIEDHPLNRIALNWPEPVQPPSESLNLDFAVTAKVLRNPVREVRDEPPSVAPKVAAAPQEMNQNTRTESPLVAAPKIEAPVVVASKIEAPKVAAPKLELPRVDVPKVEPPKAELPPIAVTKVEAPKIETVAAPPLAMAPRAKPEDNLPTASIVPAPDPNSEDPKLQPEPQTGSAAANVAALPEAAEPDADAGLQVGFQVGTETQVEAPQAIPAKKKARKAKKRPAKKIVKPAPRPRLQPAVTSASNPFGFPFAGFQNQNQGFRNQGL